MADEILGISAHADFSDLYNELSSLIAKFKESATYVSELKDELRNLANSGASTEVLVKKTRELAEAQNKASKDALAALDANSRYWTALNTAGKDITDVQKAHSELNRAYKELSEGAKESKAAIEGYSKAVNDSSKKTEEAGKKISQTAKKTTSDIEEESEKMGNALDSIKNKILGLVTVWSAKEFANKVLEVRGQFQQLEVAFTTMLGSETQAMELMDQLTKTAASTPFDLQGVTQGAKQLLAYGIEAEKVNDTLVHLGDIAAGLSLPLNDLVYLYGTTMTQGRMFTQDLRQFMGRGIPIAEELAKQFGVTKDKVGELVTAGKVGAEEFNKAIMAMSSEGGKFAGLMEAQSKTITGQISNIEDAIDNMFNDIGKQSEGIINGALSTVSSLVENYERVGRVLMGLVGTYGAYKAAVITVSAIESFAAKQKGIQTAATIAATGAKAAETTATATLSAAEMLHYGRIMLVQKAHALLNATMLANPYVLAAVAIGGVATALLSMKTEQERVNDALEAYNQEKEEAIAKEQEHKREIEELTRISTDESNSVELREQALKKLLLIYPTIFEKYKNEADLLSNIKNILKDIAELQARTSLSEPINELNAIDKKIADIENRANKGRPQSIITSNGTTIVSRVSGLTEEDAIKLKALKQKREEIQKQITKNEQQAYLTDMSKLTKGQIQAQINERQKLIDQMTANPNFKKGKVKFGGVVGEFTKEELEAQKAAFEQEQTRRRKIADDRKKDFDTIHRDELKDAEKRLKDWQKLAKSEERAKSDALLDDNKTKVRDLSQEAWEKRRDDLQKAVTEAKKKVDADEKAKNGGITSKKDTAAEREVRTQEDLAKQRRKKKQDELQQELEAERARQQAIISEKYKGSLREQKQMELDHQKRLDEIEREKQQMIEKNIEYAAAQYDKTKPKGSKGFYARMEAGELTEAEKKAIGLTSAQQTEIDSKQKIEELSYKKMQQNVADNLIKSHQSYIDKKKEIDKEYRDSVEAINLAIVEAEKNGDTERLQGLRRSLVEVEKERAEKQVSLTLEELKNDPEYIRAFEDLDNTSTATLKHLIGMFEKAKKEASKTLTPDQLREFTSTLERLYDTIRERDPFSEMKTSIDESKKATEEYTEALEKYNKALAEYEYIKKGGFVLIEGEDGLMRPKTIEEAKKDLEAAQNNLRQGADNYLKSLNNGNKALNTALQYSKKIADTFSGLGEMIGGEFGGVMSAIGGIANTTLNGIGSISSALEKVQSNKANNVKGFANFSGQVDLYMAAASTAIGVTGMLDSLIPDAQSRYNKAVSKQKQINKLRMAVDDYRIAVLKAQQAEKNWFTVTGIQSLKDAYEEHGEIAKKYYDKFNEWQVEYQEARAGISDAMPYILAAGAAIATVVSLGAAAPALGAAAIGAIGAGAGAVVGATELGKKAISDALMYKNGYKKAHENLRVVTQHKTFFRGEETQDLQEWLNERSEFKGFSKDERQLFDKDGLINKELAQAILDSDVRLAGETQETLEELIKLREQYDEYIKSIRDYVSDMYSPLVDNMVDGLFSWLETGEDVMDNFREYASETFAEIAKDMVKQIVATTIFNPLQEQLEKIQRQFIEQTGSGMTMQQYIDATMDAIDAFMLNAEKNMPAYEDLMSYIDERMQDSGIDLTGETTRKQQSASANGISNISYDQADSIVGILLGHTIIFEQIKSILEGVAFDSDSSDLWQDFISPEKPLRTIENQSNVYEALDDRNEYQVAIQSIFSNISGNMYLLMENVSQTVDLHQTTNNKLDKIISNTSPIGEIRDIVKKIYRES